MSSAQSVLSGKDMSYLKSMIGRDVAAASPAAQQPYSPRALTPPRLYSPGRRARSPSPPRVALQPDFPLVSGRQLAELPAPAWPPCLDFRYLGYGDAGPYCGRGAGLAHRFDGIADHMYTPGPAVGGGGFVFGHAEPPAWAPHGTPPRSRNQLRLASSSAGLDDGSSAIHPDADPNVADDGPGPGEYDVPRWPETENSGRGLALAAQAAHLSERDPHAYGDTSSYWASVRSKGLTFGGGPSRVAETWRQLPRQQHLLEARMKNTRSRSGGPFDALLPHAEHSVMHSRHSTARRHPAGQDGGGGLRGTKASEWPDDWN